MLSERSHQAQRRIECTQLKRFHDAFSSSLPKPEHRSLLHVGRVCLGATMRDMCVCKKRRPGTVPPRKRISCSGADPLQIPRSHCTSAAKSSGNASRLGRGTARPTRYPVTNEESRTTISEPTCALQSSTFDTSCTPHRAARTSY